MSRITGSCALATAPSHAAATKASEIERRRADRFAESADAAAENTEDTEDTKNTARTMTTASSAHRGRPGRRDREGIGRDLGASPKSPDE